MQGFLSITNRALAFFDAEATSQPQLKAYDWALTIKSTPVNDPKSFAGSVAAGDVATVFDGTRATTVDGTTAFTSTLSSLDAGTRYRFTWTGGTNPTLRTDRGLTLNTQSVTVVVNVNNSVNFTLGAGTFGTTAVGDIIYIPGANTGETAPTPFSAVNTGFWVVQAVLGATNIQATRLPGASFSATGETVTVTSNSQIQAFSAVGVQPGDNVVISAGFASATQKTFVIDRVTSTWFEVISTTPLTLESAKTPGATGIIFYTDGKTFVHLEVDQEAVARYNGDTGDFNRLSPVQAGDKTQPGWDEVRGNRFKLIVVNKSGVTMNYICHTAR